MKTLDIRVVYTVFVCSKVKMPERAEFIMNFPQRFSCQRWMYSVYIYKKKYWSVYFYIRAFNLHNFVTN